MTETGMELGFGHRRILGLGLECELEDLIDRLDRMKGHLLADRRGDIVEIDFIP